MEEPVLMHEALITATFAPKNTQALDRNYQLRQTARALNRVSKFLVFVSLGIYPLQYLELMPALAEPWHGVLFLVILLAGLYLQHTSEIRLQRIILADEDPMASQILTILSDRPEASLSQLATALGIPRNRLEGRRFALQDNLANPYIELSRDGSVWRLTDHGQDASTDLLKWTDDPNLTRHLEEPNWSDALRGRQDGGIDLWKRPPGSAPGGLQDFPGLLLGSVAQAEVVAEIGTLSRQLPDVVVAIVVVLAVAGAVGLGHLAAGAAVGIGVVA